MGHHHQGDVMMPAVPTAAFIVIEAELLLELLIVLLDLPARLSYFYQTIAPPIA
jgi:hypothetical protein